MKEKDTLDYLTPQEYKKLSQIIEQSEEILKEIKKLKSTLSRNTRKAVRLIELADQRMKAEE